MTRGSVKSGKLAAVLAIAGLLSLASPRQLMAASDDDEIRDAAASASSEAQAQAAFDEGRALLQQGRASEACAKLEESQRLDPGLGTQLNLADCYERLGRFASAHALFAEVARAARATGQQQREEVARARATALEARVSQLVIVVAAGAGAELRVERDGTALRRDEWNVLTPVDPGVHRVRAWGPGVGEWSTEVEVGADGELLEVAIPVDDARPPFLAPWHRKLGVAAAGVGAAGVLVGSFFGLRAIAKKGEAERAGCDGRACATPESGGLRDEARNAGDVATLAMGIGAVGLVSAAGLFWLVPEPEPEGTQVERRALLEVTPQFFARGGGLWLRADF